MQSERNLKKGYAIKIQNRKNGQKKLRVFLKIVHYGNFDGVQKIGT